MKNRDKYLHLQTGKLLHLSFSNAAMKLIEQDENNFSETLRCLLLGHIRTSCMDLQEPARRSLWLNRSSKCGRIIRNPGSSLQLRVTAQLTCWPSSCLNTSRKVSSCDFMRRPRWRMTSSQVCFSGNMTRFGEISPLWQHFKKYKGYF